MHSVRILRNDDNMEQIKNNEQQKTPLNEIDYIDIPAFIRSMTRYARKYILFIVPLIICMSICLALLSKTYTKKNYVAGATFMIGVRLADSDSFDYNLSGLNWERHSTLAHLNSVLNALIESGYITQYVKESMGIKRDEELKGQIYVNAAGSTNLFDIKAVSESSKDAEEIRDTVLKCLPDAVFPAFGFIEMDQQKLYSKEESSSKEILASPVVWVAGGVVLGIFGYLGLIFLYTLRRRDVETPEDLSKLTGLPCLGRLPALKKRKRTHKTGNTEVVNGFFVVTEEYQHAFKAFRRTVAEEIRQHHIKVLLLTGIGQRKGQSTIAAELEKVWKGMGKRVIITDLALKEGVLTEEMVRCSLKQYSEEADLILIDGPSCDQSADSLILADCADAVIMVIREGASQPEELKEMFQSLQFANAKPLGYILNICRNM